jgi:hypothetical protein
MREWEGWRVRKGERSKREIGRDRKRTRKRVGESGRAGDGEKLHKKTTTFYFTRLQLQLRLLFLFLQLFSGRTSPLSFSSIFPSVSPSHKLSFSLSLYAPVSLLLSFSHYFSFSAN